MAPGNTLMPGTTAATILMAAGVAGFYSYSYYQRHHYKTDYRFRPNLIHGNNILSY